MECAARMPGDMITALISIAYGRDVIEAYLRILRGERPALPARATGARRAARAIRISVG
ncbi:hypothetical protein GA0070215_11264 [Micromonospora marina]|uniref:Uncharacterized protein n=1 Tax=Micromonospora marina TaxID=307120 RepID=A0A1C4YR64_9ACTN|nr:hypothetical protein GA0070215_11264 [Micromonospora marina]